jgi:hypothetical protein
MAACQPRPDLNARVKDMVVKTAYDPAANFSSYGSYSLAIDTLGLFWSFDPDTLIVDEYAPLISRAVETNLNKAGYQHVGPKQNPDLAVNVFLVRGYYVDQTFNTPNYYFKQRGNFSYSYSGYGGYSPYPYVSPFFTSSSMLLVEIIDLKNINAQKQVKIVWTAFMGDVDASPDPFQKSKEGIDQAFLQSAYIKK